MRMLIFIPSFVRGNPNSCYRVESAQARTWRRRSLVDVGDSSGGSFFWGRDIKAKLGQDRPIVAPSRRPHRKSEVRPSSSSPVRRETRSDI